MQFPKNLEISILSKDRKQLMLTDIIVSITLFARQKNDYRLGPFFSNASGVVKIEDKQLIISADAVIETGIMDYCHYSDCLDKVMIEILDSDQLKNLIKGIGIWGLIKDEKLLYGSKENLLNRIKNSNNHLVRPKKVEINFSGQDTLRAEIITEQITPH